MNLLHPPRLSALAREHALGLLRGGARRRFEQLLASSEAARAAVAGWQEDLAVLAASVPPLQPRPAVWHGLRQRLGWQPSQAAEARRQGWLSRWWVGGGDAERGNAGALFSGARRGVLGGALAGIGAGVVLSTVLLQQNPAWLGHEVARDALPASYVGLLTDAQGAAAVLVSSRRHGRVLTVKVLKPLAPPPGQVARLWAFPKGGGAPFALGIAPASGSASLALPDTSEKLFFHVYRLGLSFEGQEPPAAPTNALVASGPCVKLW